LETAFHSFGYDFFYDGWIWRSGFMELPNGDLDLASSISSRWNRIGTFGFGTACRHPEASPGKQLCVLEAKCGWLCGLEQRNIKRTGTESIVGYM